MAWHKQCRQYPQGVKDCFLMQAQDGPSSVIHSWICYSQNRKKWLWMDILSGRLGCSDYEIVRPKTLWGTEEDKYQNTQPALQENWPQPIQELEELLNLQQALWRNDQWTTNMELTAVPGWLWDMQDSHQKSRYGKANAKNQSNLQRLL